MRLTESRRGASWGRGIAALVAAMTLATSGVAQDPTAVPEAEENDVATLPPLDPRWAFITDWVRGGIQIVDGASGKLIGTVHSAPLADFAIDPAGKFFYVAETIWTRGNRGTRQDLLTVYDARTLKIVSEIDIPGRLLIGNRPLNLTISPDGRYAFVYNLSPSTEIQVVDLVRRRFVRSVEVPGCGLAIAAGRATASLCSDGSLVTATYDAKMQATLNRAPVFFAADADPIFDNSFVDHRSGKTLFLSYSGLAYDAQLGPEPVIGAPWSIQEAAGMPKASTEPLRPSWFPGGRQPIAVDRATGRAYVLMHMGEYWSQKVAGTELWEIDIASRKVLRRKPLSVPIGAVAVTQDRAPLLFLSDEADTLIVMEVASFEQKHSLANAGNGVIAVPGN